VPQAARSAIVAQLVMCGRKRDGIFFIWRENLRAALSQLYNARAAVNESLITGNYDATKRDFFKLYLIWTTKLLLTLRRMITLGS
jgi:hypothetical protein